MSNEKLLNLAKLSYKKLRDLCGQLTEYGYWEKPEQILKVPVSVMLDTYLQAVLVQISLQTKSRMESTLLAEEEVTFLVSLLESDPYDLKTGIGLSPDTMGAMQRIFQSPPIVLQLLGVLDTEKGQKLSPHAFDCLLNIVLSYIYLNKGKNRDSLKAVEEFYNRTKVFIQLNDVNTIVNQRYLFVKMSNDRLDLDFYDEVMGETKFNELKKKQEERTEQLKLELEKTKEEQKLKKRTESAKRLDEYMEELNMLIGLSEVKKEINSLINLIKVKNMREKYDMPVSDMSYHMVFTGNPGTGKTTVARLVAKIYKELGIVSEGNLVETDRAGLVAGYVGQTAMKVKEVVEQAIGGILFIDEAYALTNQENGDDYGKEAIDTLVKMMEDNRDNLVVIVAGYKEEMKQFLKSNPGLISRFNKFIDFKDYSSEELFQILEHFSSKDCIEFSDEAIESLKEQINTIKAKNQIEFGNARGIRNLYENILVHQANRIVTLEEPDKDTLQTVVLEDVQQIV